MLVAKVDQQRVAAYVADAPIGNDHTIDFWVAIKQKASPMMRGLIDGGFHLERAVPDTVTRAIRKPGRLPMRRVEAVADDTSIVERAGSKRGGRRDASALLGSHGHRPIGGISG